MNLLTVAALEACVDPKLPGSMLGSAGRDDDSAFGGGLRRSDD